MKLSFSATVLVLSFAAGPALAETPATVSSAQAETATPDARCTTCPAPEQPEPKPAPEPERGMSAPEFGELLSHRPAVCPRPAHWRTILYDAYATGLLSKSAYWFGRNTYAFPWIEDGRIVAACNAPPDGESVVPTDVSTEVTPTRPPPKEPTDPVLLTSGDGPTTGTHRPCITCPTPEPGEPEPPQDRGMSLASYQSMAQTSSPRCYGSAPWDWQQYLRDAYRAGLLSLAAYQWGLSSGAFPIISVERRIAAVCRVSAAAVSSPDDLDTAQ